jgi:hypothetical protein
MTLKNIPSTNPHKLSAERVAKVTKALIRRLVEKGVLAPPAASTPKPETPKPTNEELKSKSFNGILDGQPQSTYRAFRIVDGGKPDAPDSSDDPNARGKP